MKWSLYILDMAVIVLDKLQDERLLAEQNSGKIDKIKIHAEHEKRVNALLDDTDIVIQKIGESEFFLLHGIVGLVWYSGSGVVGVV